MCHQDSPASASLTDTRRSTAIIGEQHVPTVIHEPSRATKGETPLPLIILITDIYGVNPFYEYLAARLADLGHRVAIPDVFHRIGPADGDSRDAALARRRLLDDVQALTDIESVIVSCTSPTPAAPGEIGYAVIGFCLGGSFALVLAADHPEQATITYYAFPRGTPGARVPASAPIERAASIAGPVLAFWGRQDYIDAGDVDELTDVLRRGPSDSETVWYERAGHSFLAALATPNEESEAAEDSWRRSTEFLSRHRPTRSTIHPRDELPDSPSPKGTTA